MKAIRNVLQVWNIDNAEFLGTLPIALDSQMSQQSSLFGAAKSFADTKSYNDYIEALESLAGAADVAMLQRYHRAVNESLISRLCTFSNSSFRPPLANANTQLLLAAAANSMTVVVCEAAACDSSVLDHDAVISAIYTLYADIIYVTKHNINSSEFGSLMQDSGFIPALSSFTQAILAAVKHIATATAAAAAAAATALNQSNSSKQQVMQKQDLGAAQQAAAHNQLMQQQTRLCSAVPLLKRLLQLWFRLMTTNCINTLSQQAFGAAAAAAARLSATAAPLVSRAHALLTASYVINDELTSLADRDKDIRSLTFHSLHLSAVLAVVVNEYWVKGRTSPQSPQQQQKQQQQEEEQGAVAEHSGTKLLQELLEQSQHMSSVLLMALVCEGMGLNALPHDSVTQAALSARLSQEQHNISAAAQAASGQQQRINQQQRILNSHNEVLQALGLYSKWQQADLAAFSFSEGSCLCCLSLFKMFLLVHIDQFSEDTCSQEVGGQSDKEQQQQQLSTPQGTLLPCDLVYPACKLLLEIVLLSPPLNTSLSACCLDLIIFLLHLHEPNAASVGAANSGAATTTHPSDMADDWPSWVQPAVKQLQSVLQMYSQAVQDTLGSASPEENKQQQQQQPQQQIPESCRQGLNGDNITSAAAAGSSTSAVGNNAAASTVNQAAAGSSHSRPAIAKLPTGVHVIGTSEWPVLPAPVAAGLLHPVVQLLSHTVIRASKETEPKQRQSHGSDSLIALLAEFSGLMLGDEADRLQVLHHYGSLLLAVCQAVEPKHTAAALRSDHVIPLVAIEAVIRARAADMVPAGCPHEKQCHHDDCQQHDCCCKQHCGCTTSSTSEQVADDGSHEGCRTSDLATNLEVSGQLALRLLPFVTKVLQALQLLVQSNQLTQLSGQQSESESDKGAHVVGDLAVRLFSITTTSLKVMQAATNYMASLAEDKLVLDTAANSIPSELMSVIGTDIGAHVSALSFSKAYGDWWNIPGIIIDIATGWDDILKATGNGHVTIEHSVMPATLLLQAVASLAALLYPGWCIIEAQTGLEIVRFEDLCGLFRPGLRVNFRNLAIARMLAGVVNRLHMTHDALNRMTLWSFVEAEAGHASHSSVSHSWCKDLSTLKHELVSLLSRCICMAQSSTFDGLGAVAACTNVVHITFGVYMDKSFALTMSHCSAARVGVDLVSDVDTDIPVSQNSLGSSVADEQYLVIAYQEDEHHASDHDSLIVRYTASCQNKTWLTHVDALCSQLQDMTCCGLSKLPTSFCCNNPACVNLSKLSEYQLVSGKACVCGRCKMARYCSKVCQKKHRKHHKQVCRL